MNETVFFFFYNLAHQSVFLDKAIIFFANIFPFAVVILAGLFLLFHHEIIRAENPFRVFWQKKKEIIKVFGTSFLAYFVSEIFKFSLRTLRPSLALPDVYALFAQGGYAFPSGHATFFSALAFSIFFLHKKAGYIFMVFALLIGLARIVAGVHFPIDILGGFILGGLVAYIVAYFIKKA
ncbi:phosphatase PAP2 family protein [Candidatus Nomurabacteria bacterium]|nr:phosphatase PAP2 family protein [Candidatus Nomurabacteria bacterium]